MNLKLFACQAPRALSSASGLPFWICCRFLYLGKKSNIYKIMHWLYDCSPMLRVLSVCSARFPFISCNIYLHLNVDFFIWFVCVICNIVLACKICSFSREWFHHSKGANLALVFLKLQTNVHV